MSDDIIPVTVVLKNGDEENYHRVEVHTSGWVECYNLEQRSDGSWVKSERQVNYPEGEVKRVEGPSNSIGHADLKTAEIIESIEDRLGSIDKTLDMGMR